MTKVMSMQKVKVRGQRSKVKVTEVTEVTDRQTDIRKIPFVELLGRS